MTDKNFLNFRWLGPVAVVLAIGMAGHSVYAATTADKDWQTLYRQAQSSYQSGDLASAESGAQQALKLARQGSGQTGSYIASSLNLLALISQKQGDNAKAADLLRQAMTTSKSGQGLEANTAAIALNLGRTLESLGQPAQALEAYRQALDSADHAAAGATVAPVRQQTLQALGRLYADQGQPVEAERYNQRLLQAQDELPAALRADALEQQAKLEQNQGQLEAARRSLEQALQQRENQQPADGEALLRTVSSLAGVLGQAGLYDEAAPLHRRAVEMLEVKGEGNSALAGHLNELGLWHLQRKEYPQAEALMQQALSIVEKEDATSLETARIVANLAQLNEERQDIEQAKALFSKALSIYESHGNEPEALLGQAQALNFLAGQEYRRRRFAQAEPQFLKALALTEQADGQNSPRLLPLLENLVALYRSQQRPTQAAPYAERAERLRRELEAASAPAKAG